MSSKWRKAFKLGAAATVVGGGGVGVLYMSSVVSAERKKEQVCKIEGKTTQRKYILSYITEKF